MKRHTPFVLYMSEWYGLVVERKYRMAVKPWQYIIKELRLDRGMLLGSSQFGEMTGVEQVSALDSIDGAIKTATQWISHYNEERDRQQGGFFDILKIRKIRNMTDEELGEG